MIYFQPYLFLLNRFRDIISPLTSVAASISQRFGHVVLFIFKFTYFDINKSSYPLFKP